MAKSIKLKNNNYIDSSSVVHNQKKLKDILNTQVVTESNTNLNDFKENGIYMFTSALTPTNIPSGVNGWLVVFNNGANWVKQIWFKQGTLNSNDFETYVRTSAADGSSWSNWQRFIVENDIFFKSGDKFTINEWYCAGFITNGNTEIRFTIPLPKNTSKISKASINQGTLNIRSITGTYLENNLDMKNSKVSIKYLRDNYITIYVKNTSAYNTTNNTPVGVAVDNLVITFS